MERRLPNPHYICFEKSTQQQEQKKKKTTESHLVETCRESSYVTSNPTDHVQSRLWTTIKSHAHNNIPLFDGKNVSAVHG